MSIRKARNAKIEYGSVEISEDAFTPRAVRRRISIMIPEDVLARLRADATAEDMGYQTLINRLLRDATSKGSLVSRMERIEKKLANKRG